MPEWLDAEGAAVLATLIVAIGTAVGAVVAGARKAERAAAAGAIPVTADLLEDEMIDVKGEVRQMRQELRLEHAATRRRTEELHDRTADQVTALRIALVELRALVSRRD